MGRLAKDGVRRRARRAVLATAVTTATALLGAGAAQAASGTLVKSNCAPAAASTDGVMVWHARNAAGLDAAYIGDTSCNGKPLLPPVDGHRGPSDITPDGRYVVLVTALGWDRTTVVAEPGKGSGNAIQLYDRQTGKLSTLLPGATKTQRGGIWPKLSPDGKKLVWTQMVKAPAETGDIWGDWEVHIADVDLAAGTLSNNRAWRDPAGGTAIYEAYGWVPQTNKVIFQSTTRAGSKGFKASQLWTLPDTFTAATAPTRVSPPMAQPYKWQKPADVFHEFAHFSPGDPNTLYTSIASNTMGGNDLWKYDMRTQDPTTGLFGQGTRISYFGGDMNKNLGTAPIGGWPQPSYKVVTAMAWDKGTWVAGVCPDIYCVSTDAWRITLG